jgi:hypothetical protein
MVRTTCITDFPNDQKPDLVVASASVSDFEITFEIVWTLRKFVDVSPEQLEQLVRTLQDISTKLRSSAIVPKFFLDLFKLKDHLPSENSLLFILLQIEKFSSVSQKPKKESKTFSFSRAWIIFVFVPCKDSLGKCRKCRSP